MRVYNINNKRYIKSSKPIVEGDLVIDRNDGCYGIADIVTEKYVSIKNPMGGEGVPLRNCVRLTPVLKGLFELVKPKLLLLRVIKLITLLTIMQILVSLIRLSTNQAKEWFIPILYIGVGILSVAINTKLFSKNKIETK